MVRTTCQLRTLTRTRRNQGKRVRRLHHRHRNNSNHVLPRHPNDRIRTCHKRTKRTLTTRNKRTTPRGLAMIHPIEARTAGARPSVIPPRETGRRGRGTSGLARSNNRNYPNRPRVGNRGRRQIRRRVRRHTATSTRRAVGNITLGTRLIVRRRHPSRPQHTRPGRPRVLLNVKRGHVHET